MCTGLEIAAGVMLVGGTASKIAGDISAGNAAADQARRQAAIDEENAKLGDTMALESVRRGEVEVGKIREAGARIVAKQRVAAVSQNIDPTSGTAADLQEGAAEVTQEQVKLARLSAAWEAYGFKTQGIQFQQVAAARRAAAGSYETAGYVGAFGDALSGGASLATAGVKWWRDA